MSRLQSLVGRSASLGRRHVLVGGVGLTLVGWRRSLFMSASRTPRLNMKRLNAGSSSIAQRARPGVLGFGLMNLESGEFFVENGDRTFPMVSVFKLPLAASVLSEVDAGALNLAEMVTLRGLDLSPPFSPIADAWPMRSTYSLGELFTAALRDSDNTAADVLMRRIGGPGAISGCYRTGKSRTCALIAMSGSWRRTRLAWRPFGRPGRALRRLTPPSRLFLRPCAALRPCATWPTHATAQRRAACWGCCESSTTASSYRAPPPTSS